MWKTPVEKPDIFKPHRILVIYEAHDEPELMFSAQYDACTADRYVNRWCYWDEFIAAADRAERLQKGLEDIYKQLDYRACLECKHCNQQLNAIEILKDVEQLIKEL